MKNSIIKKTGLFIIGLSIGTAVLAGNFSVDTSKSQVKWLGKKVTGEHYGTINIQEASLQLDGDVITGGTVVIDMNSIVCEDITNAGTNERLVNHLKSDDFFSVSTFPTARLVVTKAEKSGNNHTVTGNLTIKGITHPVTFTAASKTTGNNLELTGKIVIDRSKYDVRFGSGSFFSNLGDNLIHDDFTLDFTLVAAQK